MPGHLNTAGPAVFVQSSGGESGGHLLELKSEEAEAMLGADGLGLAAMRTLASAPDIIDSASANQARQHWTTAPTEPGHFNGQLLLNARRRRRCSEIYKSASRSGLVVVCCASALSVSHSAALTPLTSLASRLINCPRTDYHRPRRLMLSPEDRILQFSRPCAAARILPPCLPASL